MAEAAQRPRDEPPMRGYRSTLADHHSGCPSSLQSPALSIGRLHRVVIPPPSLPRPTALPSFFHPHTPTTRMRGHPSPSASAPTLLDALPPRPSSSPLRSLLLYLSLSTPLLARPLPPLFAHRPRSLPDRGQRRLPTRPTSLRSAAETLSNWCSSHHR
jgi:hypothetical protein